MHRTHILFSYQFLLRRMFFVNTTPRFKYHMKILIFNGILSFQIVMSFLTLLFDICDAYMDHTGGKIILVHSPSKLVLRII
jgi:hypothetical protein